MIIIFFIHGFRPVGRPSIFIFTCVAASVPFIFSKFHVSARQSVCRLGGPFSIRFCVSTHMCGRCRGNLYHWSLLRLLCWRGRANAGLVRVNNYWFIIWRPPLAVTAVQRNLGTGWAFDIYVYVVILVKTTVKRRSGYNNWKWAWANTGTRFVQVCSHGSI